MDNEVVDVNKTYTACLDSVNLIYAILAKEGKTQANIDSLKANSGHLEHMLTQAFWENQNLVIIQDAITAVKAWLDLGLTPVIQTDSSNPVVQNPYIEDPRIWWIDEGPLKDRLGMDAPAIYASNHPVCRGVVGLISGRQYINLKDPRITMMLSIMVANAQPTADPVWPGSGPMTPAKVLAITTTPTTEYERHVKGLRSS